MTRKSAPGRHQGDWANELNGIADGAGIRTHQHQQKEWNYD
jgi:hypothetical protein